MRLIAQELVLVGHSRVSGLAVVGLAVEGVRAEDDVAVVGVLAVEIAQHHASCYWMSGVV